MREFDVCIIGSGPAGAGAAKSLTGSGLKTVILEKQRLPRYKMCSGMLFPEAQQIIRDHFGRIPEEILSDPKEFNGIRVYPTKETPLDSPTEIPMPSRLFSKLPDLAGCLLNVSRGGLDSWLCAQSDANVLDGCRLLDMSLDNGHVQVRFERDGETLEIKSRFLVGADGGQSRVRRVFLSDPSKPIMQIPAYEEHYIGEVDLDVENWFYAFLDPELSQGFASFHKKDNRLITVSGALQGNSAKAYLNRFRAHLESVHGLRAEECVHSYGIVLTDMCFRGDFRLGRENILLCGEAAGFMRFFTEGITTALITGRKVGESILESMKTGRQPLEIYARAVAREMDFIMEQHKQYSEIQSAGDSLFV